MRTLLVDNFDSYTYNLFQLIARVQGIEPVVLRNDAPEASDLDLEAFDNIVISPGPGHPGNSRDFGFSRRVLTDATVPVLGVCLGHQGIGLIEQADVGPAPAARHGHLAAIRHEDPELFAGIPQDFIAVRYHSLCVREPLPESLRAIAWSDDGVLMGLRHRDRALWGVQFHPESVLTEHGDRLLANFADITRRRNGGQSIVLSQPFAEVDPPIEPMPKPVGLQLRKLVLDKAIDAEAAFAERFARAPRAFWLDSSQVEPGRARFSFLGDGTGPLAEFVRYDIRTRTTEVQRPGQLPRTYAGSVFDYLDNALTDRRVDDSTLPFDFTCGYVGYFGYEMKADCGATNTRHAATPDACWMFADRLVVVDHEEDTTYLLCLAEDTPSGIDTADRWLDRTAAFLRSLPERDDDGPLPEGKGETAEPWLLRNRQWYLADIEACKRELVAGESYEVCLTNAAWLPAPTDPLGYYRILRRFNPAPYAAYLQFGDVTVACSSPERFLKVGRDRTVETKPIKGTAARGADPARDAELRTGLATDPKSHAENLMIVDLLRNDLGQVCEVGSVHVPKLMAVESYATVHQLVSTVRGKLRDGVGAVESVRARFPGGSMTGAPKLRTLEIIDSLETEARGVYSGTIGFLSCNGTADLNIVIRTAVMVEGRMHLGAGGAIVLDSDPAAEYQEMLLKMAAPMRAYRAWMAAQGLRDAQRPASQRPHLVSVTNLPRRWPNGRTPAGANASLAARVPVPASITGAAGKEAAR